MGQANVLHIITIVFCAVTFVVIGDTAGKLLTMAGVDPFIVAWTRFALAALVLFPFSGIAKNEFRQLFHGRVLIRASFVAAAICCMLTALKTEPIANAFGAFFIGPAVSYALAIFVLREKPSRLRTALFGLSVFGVLLVVKPGFGATIGIAYALGAGVFYGLFLMMTRITAGQYRPRFLLISQLLIGTVLISPFGLSAPIPSLDTNLLVLIMVSSLGSAAGNYLLVVANKMAEANQIAPLIYTQLISATIIGVLVFGDWPDIFTLAGLALIGACGVSSLFLSAPAQSDSAQ